MLILIQFYYSIYEPTSTHRILLSQRNRFRYYSHLVSFLHLEFGAEKELSCVCTNLCSVVRVILNHAHYFMILMYGARDSSHKSCADEHVNQMTQDDMTFSTSNELPPDPQADRVAKDCHRSLLSGLVDSNLITLKLACFSSDFFDFFAHCCKRRAGDLTTGCLGWKC